MSIQAIALDMDGTLLDSNNQIHDNLTEILANIRDQGTNVFLVSGRTMEEIEEIVPDSFPYDGAVTSNGMGCYVDDKEIMQHHIDEDLVKDVIELAQKNDVYYEVHSIQGGRHALKTDKRMLEAEMDSPVPDTLKENEVQARKWALQSGIRWADHIDYNHIVKIYFFSMNLEKMDQWKKTLNKIKQNRPFTTSSSSFHNVEIMKQNINKATGLKTLLTHYQISEQDVMAIGDGQNDLPMFELCSNSVAMQNAPDDVKAKANQITEKSYDEHGLYLFLSDKDREGLF